LQQQLDRLGPNDPQRPVIQKAFNDEKANTYRLDGMLTELNKIGNQYWNPNSGRPADQNKPTTDGQVQLPKGFPDPATVKKAGPKYDTASGTGVYYDGLGGFKIMTPDQVRAARDKAAGGQGGGQQGQPSPDQAIANVMKGRFGDAPAAAAGGPKVDVGKALTRYFTWTATGGPVRDIKNWAQSKQRAEDLAQIAPHWRGASPTAKEAVRRRYQLTQREVQQLGGMGGT
jgi:hypothetical protein